MRSLSLDWKHLARLTGFALVSLLALVVLLHLAGAWLYAYRLLHVGCRGERASLEGAGYPSRAVEFPSREGYTLRGWYAPGSEHPEIAIIVLPGLSGNTAFALPDAEMLARAGYSTLIFEHRSCADPSLLFTTGYYEAQDVLGAVDYLRTRPDVAHIGVHGFSSNGTAALLAAAQEPAIEAVVAMGGFTSLEDDILDRHLDLPLYQRAFRRLVLWSINAQLGVPAREVSPISVIGQISPRPLLLIYGEEEAIFGEALYAAAGEPKDLWIVPGTGHGGYRAVAPQEYEQRIVGFFDSVFAEQEGGLIAAPDS